MDLERLGFFAQAGVMADLLNVLMLVCASVGAMAFGVLTAYAMFRVGFALMRPRRPAAPLKAGQEAANVV